MNKTENVEKRQDMRQAYKSNGIVPEEISASTCYKSPAYYPIGIDSLKTLPRSDELQPKTITREEARAVMNDDPFWTAAVQWALRRGFWSIKEDSRV